MAIALIPTKQDNVGDYLYSQEINNSIGKLNNANVNTLTNSSITLDDNGHEIANNIINLSRANSWNVSGTANSIVLTTNTNLGVFALKHHHLYAKIGFFATNTNTGITTIAIDGLSVKTIKGMSGADLGAGEIAAGQWTELIYNGVNYILLNSRGLQTQNTPLLNTILTQYTTNSTLTVKAGRITAKNFSQVMILNSDRVINFTTTGLNGLSTNTSLSIHTWYYLFAAVKADGTFGIIADSRADGADAIVDFGNASYLTATMNLIGIWTTEQGSTNLDSNFKQIQTGLRPKYKLLSPSVIDYYFYSASGGAVTSTITFPAPPNSIISCNTGCISDTFDLYSTDENSSLLVKNTITNTSGRVAMSGPGDVTQTQFNSIDNLKLNSNSQAIMKSGDGGFGIIIQIRAIQIDLHDF